MVQSACIESHLAKTPQGYARAWYKNSKILAHRLAWIKAYGDIPKGMYVLHKCDNRVCVNVEHLFLGTIADNNKDCMDKGRHVAPKGEHHGKAVLTDDEVEDIRSMYAIGIKQSDIADTYNVPRSTINALIRNRNRKG